MQKEEYLPDVSRCYLGDFIDSDQVLIFCRFKVQVLVDIFAIALRRFSYSPL
jgi:hypothetical protein